MYFVAYDMFQSNSTIFRSLRAMIMQHICQSARRDPIYIVRWISFKKYRNKTNTPNNVNGIPSRTLTNMLYDHSP